MTRAPITSSPSHSPPSYADSTGLSEPSKLHVKETNNKHRHSSHLPPTYRYLNSVADDDFLHDIGNDEELPSYEAATSNGISTASANKCNIEVQKDDENTYIE
ncbi:6877_t:CDS:2 [Ambispora leptoticha]|uniref:6877_t:CDS:1 n=1 Tax=Ambispora leptoticha TaxID=144679 RepID=A0A9N9BR92_9GLOM|nr:6877_t:CDS:2 [Ambispora leptoticha]